MVGVPSRRRVAEVGVCGRKFDGFWFLVVRRQRRTCILVLEDIDGTQGRGQGRFPATKASAGPIRGCDTLGIGQIGQRLRNWALRPVIWSAWSGSAGTIGRLRGSKGLRSVMYREILIERLGGWGLIIMVDEKRRPVLAPPLSTTTPKPEEE